MERDARRSRRVASGVATNPRGGTRGDGIARAEERSAVTPGGGREAFQTDAEGTRRTPVTRNGVMGGEEEVTVPRE